MSESLTPWREPLARWPDEWRERWGRRANQLEEHGLHWVEAEKLAWNETLAAKQQPVAAVERPRTTTRTLFREVA